MPPTTPPTMAPVEDFFLGLGVGVGEGVCVFGEEDFCGSTSPVPVALAADVESPKEIALPERIGSDNDSPSSADCHSVRTVVAESLVQL